MSDSTIERSQVDVELESSEFFEPTIEESIMASGLHQQFVLDDEDESQDA